MHLRVKPLLASIAVTASILILGALLRPAASAGPPGEPARPQITATPTPCPPPTPELLAVEPVRSPTLLGYQDVAVRIGNGRLVRITSESGVAQATATGGVATVRVPLLPKTTHNLLVEAEVFVPGGVRCGYNYFLSTRTDRAGGPLRIVQAGYGVWLPLLRR